MYKIYFRQAIEMLKQNTFISLIAILGTALAIMMIMSIIVSDEIRNISVAPEVNRDRTYYVTFQVERDTVISSWGSGMLNYKTYKEYLSDLKTPELTVFQMDRDALIRKNTNDEILNAKVMNTSDSYWKLFSFDFVEGIPFGEAQMESGIKEAVITDRFAQKLFKGEKAIGEMFLINSIPYRVIGIVKEVSPVFKKAYSDVWVPFTSMDGYERWGLTLLLLLRHDRDLPALDQEIRDAERRYGTNNPNKILSVRGPENHKIQTLGLWASSNDQAKPMIKSKQLKSFFIFLILLLVPAINLSGLSQSRMKRRTAEIGVRKAFGAKRHVLLMQVLYENLITSLIGGIIGLFLSYLVIHQMKYWLLGIPQNSPIPVDTLISWPVFLSVFLVCVLLNILSAGIPAFRASRMTIVNSLNQNDK